jgi:hypothetical protein
MGSCSFGDSLPFDSVKEVVSMLRSGALDDPNQKWKLVKEISCIVGTSANMMDDSDDISDDLMGSAGASIADELERLVPEEENPELMQAIPVIAIIKILLPILISIMAKSK